MRRCAGAPGRSVPMAIGWVTLRENRTGATGMGSIVRAPAAPLSQLVDTIWDWDMPRQAHRFDRMLPSACGQLVINLVEDERSEEHTSELQSLMRTSYAVFCWK